MVKRDPPPETPAFKGTIGVSTDRVETTKRQSRARELRRRMSRPRSFQRLVVEGAFDSALPAAPALPTDAFDLSDTDDAFLDVGGSALGASGLAELTRGITGKESAAEFFGVRASGRRIVIVVNTSASVVRKAARRGVSIDRIQDEAAKVIDGLEGGSSFGIVQFSQGSRSFASQLAPALRRNKSAADDWIHESLRGNPPIRDETFLGHEAAFHEAMRLRPDLIFLVTDGVLNRRERSSNGYAYPTISFDQLANAIDREMRENGVNPRLHVIGFELGDAERDGLTSLTRRYGGTLREF